MTPLSSAQMTPSVEVPLFTLRPNFLYFQMVSRHQVDNGFTGVWSTLIFWEGYINSHFLTSELKISENIFDPVLPER